MLMMMMEGAVPSRSGGERHLQPPDTFPGSKYTKNAFALRTKPHPSERVIIFLLINEI